VIKQLPEDHGRLKNFSMLLTCECQGKVYGRICNSNGYLRDNMPHVMGLYANEPQIANWLMWMMQKIYDIEN
jgi:hypothetical protein